MATTAFEQYYKELADQAEKYAAVGFVIHYNDSIKDFNFTVFPMTNDPVDDSEIQASVDKNARSSTLDNLLLEVKKDFNNPKLENLRKAALTAIQSANRGDELNALKQAQRNATDYVEKQREKGLFVPLQGENLVDSSILAATPTDDPVKHVLSSNPETRRDKNIHIAPDTHVEEFEVSSEGDLYAIEKIKSQPNDNTTEPDKSGDSESGAAGSTSTSVGVFTLPKALNGVFTPQNPVAPGVAYTPYSSAKTPDPSAKYDFKELIPTSISGFGNVFRVVTTSRAQQLENLGILRGFEIRELARYEFSRKANFQIENSNPFKVFMPCYREAIKDLTSFKSYVDDQTGKAITQKDLDDAIELLTGNALNDQHTNYGLSEKIRSIHSKLPDYLYAVMGPQYARHLDDIITAGTSMTDERTHAQAADLLANIPFGKNKHSYVIGEMVATLERAKFYDGITYTQNKEDSAKPTSFTLSYTNPTAPAGTPPLELFKAEAEKVHGSERYSLSITFKSGLSNAEFSKALHMSMIFEAQYSQFTSTNVFPIDRLAKNPEHNILMVLMAAGQFKMNVPLPSLQPKTYSDGTKSMDMENEIRTKYAPDTDKIDKMLQLWELAKDFAQIPSAAIYASKKELNRAALGNFRAKMKRGEYGEEFKKLLPDENVTLDNLQEAYAKIMKISVEDNKLFEATDVKDLTETPKYSKKITGY